MAVNTSLREIAPKLARRIQFQARPATRDLRHELFHARGLQGRPPAQVHGARSRGFTRTAERAG
ncbi:hypothetical protein AB5J72_49680 [Streptomyces sp. CG1]|uniref:hypothetical protein n=1 Tax=Streptomyces sp. CG1 TaxID=1287523 RepID=UPI0034E1BAAC